MARCCEDRMGKSLTQSSYPLMRPCTFYVGVSLHVLGVFLFLVGVSSTSWVLLDSGSGRLDAQTKRWMVEKIGPWQACTHGGLCDHPWVLVRGLGERTVRLSQLVLGVAIVLYLSGIVAMVIQMTACKSVNTRFPTLRESTPAEFATAGAAVTGFMGMFAVGELKRMIIPGERQQESPGPGFFVTLLGIVLTVCGLVSEILHRNEVNNSRMARYVYRVRRWKRRAFSSIRGKTVWGSVVSDGRPLATSDVNISVIESATEISPQQIEATEDGTHRENLTSLDPQTSNGTDGKSVDTNCSNTTHPELCPTQFFTAEADNSLLDDRKHHNISNGVDECAGGRIHQQWEEFSEDNTNNSLNERVAKPITEAWINTENQEKAASLDESVIGVSAPEIARDQNKDGALLFDTASTKFRVAETVLFTDNGGLENVEDGYGHLEII